MAIFGVWSIEFEGLFQCFKVVVLYEEYNKQGCRNIIAALGINVMMCVKSPYWEQLRINRSESIMMQRAVMEQDD